MILVLYYPIFNTGARTVKCTQGKGFKQMTGHSEAFLFLYREPFISFLHRTGW